MHLGGRLWRFMVGEQAYLALLLVLIVIMSR
jgi:hypothetical protein